MKQGKLILIIGPMCSGKSSELVGIFDTLNIAGKNVAIFQPAKNTRDKGVSSRNGLSIPAIKIADLSELKSLARNAEYIGIDEINLFEEKLIAARQKQIRLIKSFLRQGKNIIIAGLNLDYQGKMFKIIQDLIELAPDKIIVKKSVCAKCKSTNALFSQILGKDGAAILEGLEKITIDNGKYTLEPRCRSCFIAKL